MAYSRDARGRLWQAGRRAWRSVAYRAAHMAHLGPDRGASLAAAAPIMSGMGKSVWHAPHCWA